MRGIWPIEYLHHRFPVKQMKKRINGRPVGKCVYFMRAKMPAPCVGCLHISWDVDSRLSRHPADRSVLHCRSPEMTLARWTRNTTVQHTASERSHHSKQSCQASITMRRPPPHHNRFTVLFPRPPGWDDARKNFWTLWCKGRLTEADTLTIQLDTTPSGLTSAHLHHPPFFTGWMPFLSPTNSVKALKATSAFGLGRRC